MPFKGSRYIQCPECKRKRYCVKERLPDFWIKWTCSKGHVWKVELATFEKASQLMMDQLVPKLEELFNRDNAFYARLKK